MCGGWQRTNEAWQALAIATVAYFDKTMEQFLAAVDKEVERQDRVDAARAAHLAQEQVMSDGAQGRDEFDDE
jgi:hypothetical protein